MSKSVYLATATHVFANDTMTLDAQIEIREGIQEGIRDQMQDPMRYVLWLQIWCELHVYPWYPEHQR